LFDDGLPAFFRCGAIQDRRGRVCGLRAERAGQKIFRQQSSQDVEAKIVRMDAESQLPTTFLLLALHVGIFVLLLLFLLMYEQKPLPSPVQTGDAS